MHGGCHDRYLVGACQQQGADIIERADPAADRQRHETGLRRAGDHIDQRAAILVAGGNIEKAQFIRAGRIIGNRAFDRITGIAQFQKLHAFDDAAILDIQTGNDANLKHGPLP